MSAHAATGTRGGFVVPAIRPGPTAVTVAITLAGLGVGVIGLGAKHAAGHSDVDIVLDAVSGALFLAAGVLARARRRGDRVGLLLLAVGVAGLAENLQLSTIAVLGTVGLALANSAAGPLAHLVLAFPGGALPTVTARVVVGAAYGTAFGPALALLPVTDVGWRGRTNLLFVGHHPGWFAAMTTTLQVAGAVVGTAVVALLVHRWWIAGPPTRRVLAPVFAAGLIGGVASVSSSVLDASDGATRVVALTGYAIAACLLPLGLLVGVLRVRLAHGAVSRLLDELDQTLDPPGLRAALARALGDPSLLVVHPVGGSDGLIDGHGTPSTMPTDRASTPVRRHGHHVATLLHDPALGEDPYLLRAVIAAAGLALENQRLHAARARMVAAADAERRRWERDLHDGAQQRLLGVALALRAAQARVHDGPAHDALGLGADDVRAALAELRDLSRGLHPALLTEAGLVPALHALTRRCGLDVDLVIDPALPADPADPQVTATAYFTAAEALTNVARHTDAGRAVVELGSTDGLLVLTVHDDGPGGATMSTGGTGLCGLRDRATAVGGEFVVGDRMGNGTSVTVRLPLRCPQR